MLRKSKPEILIYASSAAVYKDDLKPLTESSPTEPVDIYGMTELIGEDLFRLYQHEEGGRVAVLRISNVYGSNDLNPHVIPDIIRQLNSGKHVLELGDLSTVRDFIHVDDVVEAMVTVMRKLEKGFDIFNVGSGKGYSIRDVLNMIENLIGEGLQITVKKDRLREKDRKHLILDIKKIKETIGWTPRVELKQGLKGLLQNL
jgi:UDP-glucose 4-epimerase